MAHLAQLDKKLELVLMYKVLYIYCSKMQTKKGLREKLLFSKLLIE